MRASRPQKNNENKNIAINLAKEPKGFSGDRVLYPVRKIPHGDTGGLNMQRLHPSSSVMLNESLYNRKRMSSVESKERPFRVLCTCATTMRMSVPETRETRFV